MEIINVHGFLIQPVEGFFNGLLLHGALAYLSLCGHELGAVVLVVIRTHGLRFMYGKRLGYRFGLLIERRIEREYVIFKRIALLAALFACCWLFLLLCNWRAGKHLFGYILGIKRLLLRAHGLLMLGYALVRGGDARSYALPKLSTGIFY